MLSNLTTGQVVLLIVGLSIMALIWLYIAARLMAAGVVKSWFEFMRKNRGKKQQRKEEVEDEY